MDDKSSSDQTCSYCGCENDATANHCRSCGTTLSENALISPTPISIPTLHKTGGLIQQKIWEYFALGKRRFYTAGILICLLAIPIFALKHPKEGIQLWMLPMAIALGASAVWLLRFVETLQARVRQARAEGKPTALPQAMAIVLGLATLIAVVVLVTLAIAFFIELGGGP